MRRTENRNDLKANELCFREVVLLGAMHHVIIQLGVPYSERFCGVVAISHKLQYVFE